MIKRDFINLFQIILEAILPCYMQQIQSPSYILCEGKSERDIIAQLAVAVRTMVHNCEGFTKFVLKFIIVYFYNFLH